MIPPSIPAPAVLTAIQERDLAHAIRAGRRARLLAQRHLAARLRRELPPAVNARAAAGTVLATLLPRLPLDQHALPTVVGPLLPRALDDDARARVLANLAVWPLDQDALRAGDDARAAFITANQRLVVAVARRYQQRGLLLDDLVQEGSVGLLRAVDLFDPARGYKFSTYAVWWIKQAMRRALARQVPLAHVPDNVQMERARLARQAHALHAALGHPPSPAELAAATGLPRARVDALVAPLPAPVPLDQLMGEGETTTLGDLLPDPAVDRPDAAAEAHALAAAVHTALATLDPRARAILVARHGLDGAPPRTLHEIGQQLGLTRERVRQIEAKALTRLRDPALRHWLATDDTPAAS
jgi:RNA polymerase primary sigma factor